MRNVAWLIVLLSIAVSSVSCGTTRITVDDPKAKIYVDGSYVGDGSADIRRTGVPARSDIIVKRGGKVVSQLSISREMTWVTLITGLFTLYTGFIWAWQYPADVNITLPAEPKRGTWEGPENLSPWDAPAGGGSGWDAPPNAGTLRPEGN